jgi:general secretion pathway protein N
MSTPTTPNQSPWGWAWAGALVGLASALLVNAPAHWLTQSLQQASAGRLLLKAPRGTVWQGSAQLMLAGGVGSADAAALPGRLSWHISPSLSGLSVQLLADCCMQQAWHLKVQPRWGGVQLSLSNSLSQWPAMALAGLGTPWNTVQAEGQLSLTTQGLSAQWTQGRLQLSGRAQLDAQHLASRLSTLKPMGSYRLTLNGGPTPELKLETLEGSLQLTGSGQWVGGKLRFDGVASAAPERTDALANLLNIIGRRDGARALIKIG